MLNLILGLLLLALRCLIKSSTETNVNSTVQFGSYLKWLFRVEITFVCVSVCP